MCTVSELSSFILTGYVCVSEIPNHWVFFLFDWYIVNIIIALVASRLLVMFKEGN